MRQRKSVALHRLEGTFRPDRHRPGISPERFKTCPKPPSRLDAGAKAEWKSLAPIAHGLGVLNTLNCRSFEVLCVSLAASTSLASRIEAEGYTVPGRHGPKANPLLAVMNRHEAMALKLLREFGMTPSSQVYVEPAPEREEPSEFNKYFD